MFKRIAEQVLRMKSILPDVPRYAPHYTPPPERTTKEKATPRPGTQMPDFKVLDASMTSSQGGNRPSLSFGEILVPDYSGQPARTAVDESVKLGLVPKTSGSGRVIGQDPPPGSRVRPDTPIRFVFSLK